MASIVQLSLCVVALVAVGANARAVKPGRQSFHWLLQDESHFRKREASEALGDEEIVNATYSYDVGPDECFLRSINESVICMADVQLFVNSVTEGIAGIAPFNTNAARVARFCQQIPGVVECLNNVASCSDDPYSHPIMMAQQFQYVCSEQGQQGLISIDGDSCDPNVNERVIARECRGAYQESRQEDMMASGSFDECAMRRVGQECERQATLARCGENIANFMSGAAHIIDDGDCAS